MPDNDHARRLKSMLLQVSPDSQIETLAAGVHRTAAARPDAGATLEAARAGLPVESERLDVLRSDELESFALETLDVLARDGLDAPLTAGQQAALEAIVLPRFRPVVNIVNDTFSAPPEPWEHLGAGQPKARIEGAIRSIGRIEVPRHPRLIPYAGTGFVVARLPNGGHLMMTNRHVAELFATGLGRRNLAFHPGQQVAVDLRREIVPTPPQLLAVESVVMIHPYWDMALLRVSGLPEDHPVLSLSTENPADAAERDVVVIGYPAQDWRNDLDLQNRIFGGIFEVKRMQPGKLKTREKIDSYGRKVNAVTHDSSTLGGNSGSAVIEFSDVSAEAPARVIGLHFAGEYLKANYAVPAYDLAQDSRVVETGVNFAGRVEPRGDFYGPIWRQTESDETTSTPEAKATPQPGTAQSPAGGVSLPMTASPSSATWTIPLHVSVSVGTPTLATPLTGAAPPSAVPGTAAAPPPEGLFGRRPPAIGAELVARFSADSLLATEFSWDTALSLALASNLAYSNRAAVESTTRNVWHLESCEFIEADDTQCFVASSDRAVLVAFRGTESLGDWLADLNVLSTTRPYGTVHRGFRNAFAVVAAALRATISGHGDKPVVITGHSLGGALALIAAAEWQGTFPIPWIYTYGQPCVGRGNFVAFMRDRYGGTLVRFVNDDDIVPRVPPTYRHVGRLIHFDAAGNVQRRTESLAAEAVPGTDPAVLTEPEFDQLRAHLLAARSRQREIASTEWLPGTGPLASDTSPAVAGFTFPAGPAVATAAQLDRLRAFLLAERSRRDAGGLTESLSGPAVEGLFPSFSDHSLERYIARIAAHAGG